MGACLKPTAQQLEAFARLRTDSDGIKLVEALKDYEAALTEAVISATDAVQIHRNQGAVKVLRELREAIGSAPDTLRRIQTIQRNTP